MTVSYQITRRDFVDANIAMSGKTRWFLFCLWAALLVFSAWSNFDELLHGSGAQRIAVMTPITFCGVIFLLLAWGGPYYRARRMILREMTWTFGAAGVHVDTNVSSADVKWEAFLRYRETPKLFLLFVQKGAAQFIPKRVLSSEQADELRRLLVARVKNT